MAYRKLTLLLLVIPVLLAAMLAVGLLRHRTCDSRLVYPREQWSRQSPEESGFDPQALAAMEKVVQGAGCLVKDGFLVYDWGPYNQNANVASIVKPLIVHFVLRAHQDGLIPDLDGRLADVQPRLLTLNPDLDYKDHGITWRQMMQQTSGYGIREGPGEAFSYSDPQMALLWDTLVYKVHQINFGSATRDLLQGQLTGPLGCEDKPRLTPEGRLRISARDMARIGLLYLGKGCWRGQHLLDPDLLLTATSSPLPPAFPRTTQEEADLIPAQRTLGKGINMEAHQNSYSYCWWLNGVRDDGERVLPDAPPDTYGAFGHGGRHALIIVPSHGLVLSWVIGLGDPYPWRFSIDGRKRVNEALRLAFQGIPEAE